MLIGRKRSIEETSDTSKSQLREPHPDEKHSYKQDDLQQSTFDDQFFGTPEPKILSYEMKGTEIASFQVLGLKFKVVKPSVYGAYGIVSFFKADNVPIYLVVKKVERGDLETLVVNTLNILNIHCGTIKARVGPEEPGAFSYIFLQYMDTDLAYFCKDAHRLKPPKIAEVIQAVYRQIECLYQKSGGQLLFLDIKPENVLVKFFPGTDQPAFVALGDLGSCVVTGDQYCTSYPYYPGKLEEKYYHLKQSKAQAVHKVSGKKAIRFFLGRMALDLLGIATFQDGKDRLKEESERQNYQAILTANLGPAFNNLLHMAQKSEQYLLEGTELSMNVPFFPPLGA